MHPLFPQDDFTDRSSRWDSEAFIPLHPLDLVECLIHRRNQQALNAASRFPHESLRESARLLSGFVHTRYKSWQERLIHLYAPLDPDRDTRLPSEAMDCGGSIAERFKSVHECLELILQRANYDKLTRDEIIEAIDTASYWGVQLRLNLDKFLELHVYSRGDVIGKRKRRNWKRFFRQEEVDVPIYQRLVVLFRIKPDAKEAKGSETNTTISDKAFIRMFKNVPKMDVDMMLPATGVKMSLFDQGKILLPTLYGIGVTIWKVIKGTLFIAFLGVFKTFALVVVVAFGIFYSIKSFFTYTNTKRRYLLNVAQSLYYQNLDNNQGVLLKLLTEAEQQEICEGLLTLSVLQNELAGVDPTTPEIDQQCEAVLFDLLGIKVDFDIENGLRLLKEMNLIVPHADRWRLNA